MILRLRTPPSGQSAKILPRCRSNKSYQTDRHSPSDGSETARRDVLDMMIKPKLHFASRLEVYSARPAPLFSFFLSFMDGRTLRARSLMLQLDNLVSSGMSIGSSLLPPNCSPSSRYFYMSGHLVGNGLKKWVRFPIVYPDLNRS